MKLHELQNETMNYKEGARSSLLIVILDTNPVWWGRKKITNTQLNLSQCVDCLTVLANSHLMLSHKNKLAIIAAHINHSEFMYPVRMSGNKDGSKLLDDSQSEIFSHPARSLGDTEIIKLPDDGQYEKFSSVEAQLKSRMKRLIAKDKEEATDYMEDLPTDSLLSGAMCKALCYINRLERECPIGESLSARLLIIKGSADCPSQYMNFMNAVFTAQKQSVVIDACILETDSGLLQQACDITGGIYLKIPQTKGMLQYLLWVFLPDPLTRGTMAFPPKAQVDYRAACFCHRNLVDIGYVCSVCLSIYCTFSPICSTCQTTFKILGPQKIAKKKIKKS